MPIIDGTFVSDLLSALPVWLASVAGALAALLVALTVIVLRRAGNGRWLSLPIALFAIGVIAAAAMHQLVFVNNMAAERRSLLARNIDLTVSALAPGSVLACLDGLAGETTENACEQAVFAHAQSVARAVGYAGARLSLLREASEFARRRGDSDLLDHFATTRRMIELDRYGLAAHVLSLRDGCTADHCYAFMLVHDASVLKANLKAQSFERYLSHHASGWEKSREQNQLPVASASSAVAPVAGAAEKPPIQGRPVDTRWDFPSSASIPPVSIMTSEPEAPKEPAQNRAASLPGVAKSGPNPVPLPPNRPQAPSPTAPPAH